MSAARSNSVTASPCAAASSAAATPAGPAPTTATRSGAAPPARAGRVRSRPVRGLTRQPIGTPAW